MWSRVSCLTRIRAEAIRRFDAYKSDPLANPIHPNLRAIVFRVAVAAKPADAVPFLIEEWAKTDTIDGKEVCLTALGHAANLRFIESDVLPLLVNTPSNLPLVNGVPPGDMHFLAASLADNPAARQLQWTWMKSRWFGLEAKIGKNIYILGRLVGLTLQSLTDSQILPDIEEFFETKDTAAYVRTLEVAKDTIRARSRYRQRDGVKLREWLAGNGYGNA